MHPIDFLAIGDIVTEPFIRLKDASVHCKINNEECEICMRWGDKIPYESAVLVPAVGNASNAAVAAARLGVSSALRAYLGDDRYGAECLEVLKREHVDTSLMVTQPGKQTNYHYVLSYESERTILVKHEEYDYTVPAVSQAPQWIYLSSLAANSLPYHQALEQWLQTIPASKLAFQPGTFQMKLGREALRGMYERSDVFFCNKEEAERILDIKPMSDLKDLLGRIRALGPKVAVITDGRQGAYAQSAEGSWFVPMYPDERAPKERTGAGDAFASTVVAALSLGKPLQEALLWGPINAMEVVQEIGAQKGLVSRERLEQLLAQAPAEYRLQSL